jgi:urease accessory protein
MTTISLSSDGARARLELRAGTIVPREIERGRSFARVALVAGGALLLGGDAITIRVVVGEGCTLELEDIGGTVAYDADGEESTWTVDVVVETGGTFLWHGLPMIVADGANVSRTMRVTLAPEARACLRETVVLGRANEIGGRLRQRTDIAIAGVPAFVEELNIGDGIDIPGVIGANRVLDSVLVAGARAPFTPPPVRVLELECAGSLARYLGADTHRSPLDSVWSSWSGSIRALRGEGPAGAAVPTGRQDRLDHLAIIR